MSCTLDSDTSTPPPQKWDLFSTELKATVTVRWHMGCSERAVHPNCRHSFGDAQPNSKCQEKAARGARMLSAKTLRGLMSTWSNIALAWVCWVGGSTRAREWGVPRPHVCFGTIMMMQYQAKVQPRTRPPRAAASTRREYTGALWV